MRKPAIVLIVLGGLLVAGFEFLANYALDETIAPETLMKAAGYTAGAGVFGLVLGAVITAFAMRGKR